nr:MAG TPA: hypothetical protein [Caudoviricetes sp.]
MPPTLCHETPTEGSPRLLQPARRTPQACGRG